MILQTLTMLSMYINLSKTTSTDCHPSQRAPRARIMIPCSPFDKPLLSALDTQYCFLPRPPYILSLAYLSLISFGMKMHCLYEIERNQGKYENRFEWNMIPIVSEQQ